MRMRSHVLTYANSLVPSITDKPNLSIITKENLTSKKLLSQATNPTYYEKNLPHPDTFVCNIFRGKVISFITRFEKNDPKLLGLVTLVYNRDLSLNI